MPFLTFFFFLIRCVPLLFRSFVSLSFFGLFTFSSLLASPSPGFLPHISFVFSSLNLLAWLICSHHFHLFLFPYFLLFNLLLSFVFLSYLFFSFSFSFFLFFLLLFLCFLHILIEPSSPSLLFLSPPSFFLSFSSLFLS